MTNYLPIKNDVFINTISRCNVDSIIVTSFDMLIFNFMSHNWSYAYQDQSLFILRQQNYLSY